MNKVRYFGTGLFLLLLWTAAYLAIEPAAQKIAWDLFSLDKGTPLGGAVEFFLYDTAKILLLLVLTIYLISWLRAGLRVERVRDYLSHRGKAVGYVLATVFGAVSPFCSCSTIPLFLGFTTARIPLGITMAFLITSPLINEVAVILLWGLLGTKFVIAYVAVGMLAGIVGGLFMDAIHAERWLQPFISETLQTLPAEGIAAQTGEERAIGLKERHEFAYLETKKIFVKVWKWILIGVGVGAFLHGYVPEAWFTEHLGAGEWWSVPCAVAIGIPLYSNATGIIPIMESLLLKGLPVGTTLAFCMSAVAASLPELMMLKQVMTWKLLTVFIATLLVMFTLVGWFFNVFQHVLF